MTDLSFFDKAVGIVFLLLFIFIAYTIATTTYTGSSPVVESENAGGWQVCNTAVILEDGMRCMVGSCFVKKGDMVNYITNKAPFPVPFRTSCFKVEK